MPVNPRFLYSALGGCSPADVMDFFENEGVPLKTERGNRVFPVSDKALDIVDALFFYVKRLGVKFEFEHIVEKILTREDGAVCGVQADGKTYEADRVIIATGGASYPATRFDRRRLYFCQGTRSHGRISASVSGSAGCTRGRMPEAHGAVAQKRAGHGLRGTKGGL